MEYGKIFGNHQNLSNPNESIVENIIALIILESQQEHLTSTSTNAKNVTKEQ